MEKKTQTENMTVANKVASMFFKTENTFKNYEFLFIMLFASSVFYPLFLFFLLLLFHEATMGFGIVFLSVFLILIRWVLLFKETYIAVAIWTAIYAYMFLFMN